MVFRFRSRFRKPRWRRSRTWSPAGHAADGRWRQGRPLVADVATVDYGTAPGEVDRYNMQRVVSLTANIHGKPLGQM